MTNKKVQKHCSGSLQITPEGDAYLISESKNVRQEIHVPKGKTGSALNGDKVFAKIVLNDDGKTYTGQVLGIIRRVKTVFIADLEGEENQSHYLVISSAKRTPFTIYIPKANVGDAKPGDKVMVKITKWKKEFNCIQGVVVSVIGKTGEHQTEIQSILLEHRIESDFPKSVLEEAEHISAEITQEEIGKRLDYRNVTTFTIDPEDAKDFDDALSFKEIEGGVEVGIHIADVSHYIKPGSSLDSEAYKRGNSIYLVDRCIPMLPERLSNGICSLRPEEEKLCFSVLVDILVGQNDNVKIQNKRIAKTVIKSDRRFTYEEAQKVIEEFDEVKPFSGPYENKKFGSCEREILQLDYIAKLIRKQRFKEGAISFEKKEARFKLDEFGKPLDVYFKTSKDSNKLIEEYMLLANRVVAEFAGLEKKKPFVYRTHVLPERSRLQELSDFVKAFGYSLVISEDEEVTKKSLNKLLSDIRNSGEEKLIETLALRTMAKAKYTTEILGHYGLGFRYYSHFTSPIRRYPDVIIHRLLVKYLDNTSQIFVENKILKELDNQCKHLSMTEDKAAKAERESVKFKQAEFLKDKIGEEFDGIISSVNKWGMMVELEKYGCEGFVSKFSLSKSGYTIDITTHSVKNSNSGKNLRLGDRVNVVVENVNIFRKIIDFSIS
jgi:ribonuclease R